jgi:MFS family permease
MWNRLITALDGNYRFLVLFASFGLILVGTGSMFAVAVALKSMTQEFGWPRSVPSIAISLLYLGGGTGGILTGHWMDRSGMGWPALVVAVMVGIGAIGVSAITQAWQLFLIYGFMLGLFGHAALFSPLLTNVIRWFENRRGTAVGVVAAGQSLAGVIWPPVFAYFIESIGWRDTYFWFGIFALATMLPLSLIMHRRAPGASEFSARTQTAVAGPATKDGERTALSPKSLQCILALAIVGCCIAMALPLGHLVAHISDLGHSTARAAEILSVALAGSLISRLTVLGPVANRYGGLVSIFTFSALQTAGLALLVFFDGLLALYLIAFLFGFGYGGIVPSYPMVVREYLPVHEGGRRTALIIFFGAIGMAIGGWLGGFVYDLVGSYTPAFLIGVAFNLGNLAVIGALIRLNRRAAN